ncbi:uncharacterized protein LOC130972970 isoform X1 [Arachis stenosperma]|uniref:uncharacterized protein LOC130972970 isoform X1 n=3 Tax=Arachis stenosperma TaxID=217475 RepID=UPI0025ACC868|nr:uncharacterized protein LOC130972970 isoform X1 [Arachis stenosperma]
MIMSYNKGFFNPKVVFLTEYFCVLFSKLMQSLFWVFTKIFMRYYSSKGMSSACCSEFPFEVDQTNPETEAEGDSYYGSCEEDTEVKYENFDSACDSLSHESNQIDSEGCEGETEVEAGPMNECCSETFVDEGVSFGLEEEENEEEPSKLVFKFEYQSWDCNLVEEESKESCDFVERDDTISSCTNKYQIFTGASFSQFLDEPQVENFTVKEFYVHSNGDDSPFENQVIIESKEGFNAEILENSTQKVSQNKVKDSEPVAEDLPHEDDDFICSSIDSDSMNFMGEEGFLSEADFGTNIDYYTLGNHHVGEENADLITDEEEDLDFLDDKDLENLDIGYEPDDFAEEDEDIMNELRKIEEDCAKEKSSGKNFEGSLKNNSDSLAAFDGEDSSRFDTLWEHQDLIEQLKMELKKVRATGLPTILEDSESPRIMEDLKPWNIDEKFHHCSNTNDLPKFYKSYRERMRKFDILNYQKMYAIGFLSSKDPLQTLSWHKKSSSFAIKDILRRPQSGRRKNKESGDATNKFMRELYSDLEMVYVGQLCLSWEFLQWEYEKALELWESDQYGLKRFNEVAGEFQQFQVLIQRFIENEPFQGPRVENYTKNRCVMRNLLQVPLIREDNSSKDKKKQRQKGGDVVAADDESIIITSDMLVEILEESIRTIWRFIRADKDASSFTLKSARETHQLMQLQDLSDSQLLLEILTDLQKKEKRLKELLRSESCILKKLKKHDYDEDGTDQVLYFFSQVDMKLVWRVLNMSRITTDQLAWCRSKLNKITFVNRRIHVEPTFLLFPS